MGTRSDYYVGKGADAEWLGSAAFDGFPDSSDTRKIVKASSELEYREAVQRRLAEEDGTRPEQGWPWPWEDSRTTDYAYTWADGEVWVSCFGRRWQRAAVAMDPDFEWPESSDKEPFPDMAGRQNVTLGPRSGLLLFGLKRQE